jgi:anti-sigma B factor antagonist
MRFHHDPLIREQWIRAYLLRRLDEAAVEEFEQHYLGCDECFQELRVTRLLMGSLAQSNIGWRRLQDVVVLEFSHPVRLVRQGEELRQLVQGVLEQKDTKVLIDLSRVSRIDSAGLGMLINCYSHAVRNRGMLKLLKPSAPVQNLLRLTRIDSVIETFDDEARAVASFQTS